MKTRAILALTAALALAVAGPAPVPLHADEPDDRPRHEPRGDAVETAEGYMVTRHRATIGDREVPYAATTGTMPLTTEAGEPRAEIFFIAYTRTDIDDPSQRPITFTFNGGPGSSSVWLHLGTFGPKRVDMPDDGVAPKPPYDLINNDASILDVTDLVFIDPVTTGFSRAEPDVDDSNYHGVEEDIRAVGEFIRRYVTRFHRWPSPKFLAGESYGTTRAAGLVGHMQDRHGMDFNGVMLISSILDFSTTRFHDGNDLPYVLFLPTYTATAWYHDQLDDDLQQGLRSTLREVEQFAIDEYSRALLLGNRLPDDERDAIIRKLARYTGLSESFIRDNNMRVSMGRFGKELRRDDRRTVGRLDSRFTGIDGDHGSDRYEFDSSMAAIRGPYTAAMNHYVRAELGWETDVEYEILTGRVRPWNYGRAGTNSYVNVAPRLRSAMSKNRDLHVLVASGYYDLATPYFASEHTFATLGLDPSLEDNVTMTYYESGHMMYIHGPSLRKLKDDIATFIGDALSPRDDEPR